MSTQSLKHIRVHERVIIPHTAAGQPNLRLWGLEGGEVAERGTTSVVSGVCDACGQRVWCTPPASVRRQQQCAVRHIRFFCSTLARWPRSFLSAVYCLVLAIKGYQMALLLLPAARKARAHAKSRCVLCTYVVAGYLCVLLTAS